jgi:metal-responsive CopG/Arc/MetJ family transcriptional regulator
MDKVRFSVTVDVAVLEAADADADAMGLNRSEMVERALRNEHLRRVLREYTSHTVSALNIDSYAERVYRANRAAGP